MLEVFIGPDNRWAVPGVEEGEDWQSLQEFLRYHDADIIRIVFLRVPIDIEALRQKRLDDRLAQIEREMDRG